MSQPVSVVACRWVALSPLPGGFLAKAVKFLPAEGSPVCAGLTMWTAALLNGPYGETNWLRGLCEVSTTKVLPFRGIRGRMKRQEHHEELFQWQHWNQTRKTI